MLNAVNGGDYNESNYSRNRTRICLESSVFTALLSNDEAKKKLSKSILQDARDKRIDCSVSALILVECEYTEQAGSEKSADLLLELFESEFLTRCNVDPFVAELARNLKQQLKGTAVLTPSQWLWLATALLQECDYLMTHDAKLLKLAGQSALGKLKIVAPCRPWDSGQLSLEDFAGVMDEEAPSVGLLRRTLVI